MVVAHELVIGVVLLCVEYFGIRKLRLLVFLYWHKALLVKLMRQKSWELYIFSFNPTLSTLQTPIDV